VTSPVGCLVFKTSEALKSVWWVRLLPLPPNSNLGTSGNCFVKDKGDIPTSMELAGYMLDKGKTELQQIVFMGQAMKQVN
jgi:hypothetical protein